MIQCLPSEQHCQLITMLRRTFQAFKPLSHINTTAAKSKPYGGNYGDGSMRDVE
jgi:hypothetical protein